MQSKSNKKILVVEDDEVNRKVMDLQLRKHFQVDIAKDGQTAIELFLQSEYNLILMDINLGAGINGIETMKRIRKTDRGKVLPVIAITAYANFGNKKEFLAEGFDNYVSKPYSSNDLLNCITDTMKIYDN